MESSPCQSRTVEQIVSQLQLDSLYIKILEPGWRESVQALEGAEYLASLEPVRLLHHCDICGFSEREIESIQSAARKIRHNSALRLLYQHCLYQLLKGTAHGKFSAWPETIPSLEELSGAFYLLVALATISETHAVHKRLSIPETVTVATYQSVKDNSHNYQKATRRPTGFFPLQLHWVRHYFQGRIFRLGRMEYLLKEMKGIGPVYKHRKSGFIVALAQDGEAFNAEGYCCNTAASCSKDYWTASLKFDSESVVGNPVSPCGFALHQTVRLPQQEWGLVLKEGDTVIDMHIPAGGGMTPERCLQSLQQAVAFFARYFPMRPARAIICLSWILNTQFERALPDSNLTFFMQNVYLFPVKSSGRDGMFFVFQRDYEDISQAPRDTSLRRTMVEILEKDEKLRSGGMFILAEDVHLFGTQKYRQDWQRNARQLLRPHSSV